MIHPKNTKRLELRVSPLIARALEALAESASVGNGRKAHKMTEEDWATEAIEKFVIEDFTEVFGVPPGVYFVNRGNCVSRRQGFAPQSEAV